MISVIIVNYHCYELTLRATESILAQGLSTQIIVVDNSADLSESQALQAHLSPDVECIISAENIGFGRACNLAFTHAVHDWIFLLNPDAFVLENCLSTLVEFLIQTPRAGAVAPIAYWDDRKSWILPPGLLATPARELEVAIAIRWRWFGARFSEKYRRWVLRCNFSVQATPQRMLSGGHMLLRRSAIEAVGDLFDPAFFMYFEDADLSLRLQKFGYRLYYLPTAAVVHEWSYNAAEEKLGLLSRQYYFAKNFTRSWLFSLAERLNKATGPLRLSKSKDLGVCTDAPTLPVMAGLESGWLLELSANPLLVPTIFHEGHGVNCQIPNSLWQRLCEGRYWARISNRNQRQSQLFSWQKVYEIKNF